MLMSDFSSAGEILSKHFGSYCKRVREGVLHMDLEKFTKLNQADDWMYNSFENGKNCKISQYDNYERFIQDENKPLMRSGLFREMSDID